MRLREGLRGGPAKKIVELLKTDHVSTCRWNETGEFFRHNYTMMRPFSCTGNYRKDFADILGIILTRY